MVWRVVEGRPTSPRNRRLPGQGHPPRRRSTSCVCENVRLRISPKRTSTQTAGRRVPIATHRRCGVADVTAAQITRVRSYKRTSVAYGDALQDRKARPCHAGRASHHASVAIPGSKKLSQFFGDAVAVDRSSAGPSWGVGPFSADAACRPPLRPVDHHDLLTLPAAVVELVASNEGVESAERHAASVAWKMITVVARRPRVEQCRDSSATHGCSAAEKINDEGAAPETSSNEKCQKSGTSVLHGLISGPYA